MKRYSSALTLALSLLLSSHGHTQGKQPPASAEATAGKPSSSLFIRREDLRPVYFASGQWQLNSGTMQMLKENIDVLKNNMPAHILIAGYSDGLGTAEQNLAMGQRRAAALRDFYVSMGIPRSRISTVSYGQEEPLCFEETEE